MFFFSRRLSTLDPLLKVLGYAMLEQGLLKRNTNGFRKRGRYCLQSVLQKALVKDFHRNLRKIGAQIDPTRAIERSVVSSKYMKALRLTSGRGPSPKRLVTEMRENRSAYQVRPIRSDDRRRR